MIILSSDFNDWADMGEKWKYLSIVATALNIWENNDAFLF